MEQLGHKIIGNGSEKILVMHNWVGDATSYEPMIPYLDTDTFTYCFLDLRGYGKSKALKGTYSVTEASQDVLHLAQSLNWEAFHLVGHSMSGMIAQKIALDSPSKIKSIVAIAPAPASGTPAPEEIMNFLRAAADQDDESAKMCVNMLTGQRYSPHFAKKMVHDWRSVSTKEARLGFLQMFANTDFSDQVQGLTTPMLVLYGEHDFEGEEAKLTNTFLKWYPNAKLECCKASGHYPMQEVPIYLASRLEKYFLTKL